MYRGRTRWEVSQRETVSSGPAERPGSGAGVVRGRGGSCVGVISGKSGSCAPCDESRGGDQRVPFGEMSRRMRGNCFEDQDIAVDL